MDLGRDAVPPSWPIAADLVSRSDRWDGSSSPVYVQPCLAPLLPRFQNEFYISAFAQEGDANPPGVLARLIPIGEILLSPVISK
jgi:hypothetical protein